MVIGLNSGGLGGETQAMIQAFMTQTGVTFPIVQDPQGYAAWEDAASASPFPFDILVDKTGIIKQIYREYDATALEAAIVQEL